MPDLPGNTIKDARERGLYPAPKQKAIKFIIELHCVESARNKYHAPKSSCTRVASAAPPWCQGCMGLGRAHLQPRHTWLLCAAGPRPIEAALQHLRGSNRVSGETPIDKALGAYVGTVSSAAGALWAQGLSSVVVRGARTRRRAAHGLSVRGWPNMAFGREGKALRASGHQLALKTAF